MDVWIITQESDYGYDGSSTAVLGWTDDPAEAMALLATDFDVPLESEWRIATTSVLVPSEIEGQYGKVEYVEMDGFDLYFKESRDSDSWSGGSEGETISIYRFPGKFS